ncbi:hypothetical protein LABOLPEG_00040 [Pseudomonas phage phi 21A]|nr:hypothetical protein LABOLPEG_00040 [Pseudomonas phage phi 21A]
MNRSTMKQITFGLNYTKRKPGLYDAQISAAKLDSVNATYANGDKNAKGLIMGLLYGSNVARKGSCGQALYQRSRLPLDVNQRAHSHIDCREAFH